MSWSAWRWWDEFPRGTEVGGCSSHAAVEVSQGEAYVVTVSACGQAGNKARPCGSALKSRSADETVSRPRWSYTQPSVSTIWVANRDDEDPCPNREYSQTHSNPIPPRRARWERRRSTYCHGQLDFWVLHFAHAISLRLITMRIHGLRLHRLQRQLRCDNVCRGEDGKRALAGSIRRMFHRHDGHSGTRSHLSQSIGAR